MFLDIIVSKCFRAFTDLFSCPIGAVGQNISYSFPADNSVKQPVEFSFVIGRACFKVRSQSKCRLL